MSGAAGSSGRASRPAAGSATGRRPWLGRRVVLGVTGGIAAYKFVQLARDLARHGAVVDVVMTRSARAFVGPISFEAVTGRPVLTDILAEGHALDHIRLAREADVVCIAPATADFIARAAAGRADDLLAAILVATRSPVLICPAMNDAMWAHVQTQANVTRLRELGYAIVGPATGPLAYGEGSGPGRAEEPDIVLEHIGRALGHEPRWEGLHVVVTAGPTREAVDAVRVLSNRSSGKMGFAIAAAAWRRGAYVHLIAGPTQVEPPAGPELIRIETAEDMARAVAVALSEADVLFMAAAVADFRPASPAAAKLKKSAAPRSLELEHAPDILRSTREHRRAGTITVGFALETGDGRAAARTKLREKALDLIVLNSADEPGAGFDVDTNRVTLIAAESEEPLPLMSKDDVAETLLDRVGGMLESRS
ncbi:MAG TPA: bifunctional phosphopantothenoylcysteine decarboxylase/phosphopantothenate--cysteine ligase CoaBC [Longimicrobiales bacterium]